MFNIKSFFSICILAFSLNANAAIDELSNLNSKSYILIDYETGEVLKNQLSTERLAPASLTKVMTAYVVFDKLKKGDISLKDKVVISSHAWKKGGSRTFVEVGKEVELEDLIKGMIIQSGNDAATAVAEHVAGSEESFTIMMNDYAKKIGMKNSNFLNVTGLPKDNHYSTAEDLGILARHMIKDFPEYYKYYSMKDFTYNNIWQKSRNRLLASNKEVDGLKTGFTNSAGYCYISSAVRNNRRLITVVLGADKPYKRFEDAKNLFSYGFSHFDTHRVIVRNEIIKPLETQVAKGEKDIIHVGADNDVVFITGKDSQEDLVVEVIMNELVIAPVKQGEILGKMVVKRNNKILSEVNVIALESVNSGDFFKVFKDSLKIYMNKI